MSNRPLNSRSGASLLRTRLDSVVRGEWTAPAKGSYFIGESLIDGDTRRDAARCDADDIERGVDAARAARAVWGRISPAERARILKRIADRIEENFDILATTARKIAAAAATCD